MAGFSFNGTHSDDMHIERATPIIPLLPARNPTTIQIPGRDGTVDFENDSYGTRVIPVDILMDRAATAAELSQWMEAVAAWLSASNAAIIFDSDTTIQWTGKLYQQIDMLHVPLTRQFIANFECQPYAQDVTETQGAAIGTETDYGSDVEFFPDINISLYELTNDLSIGNMDDAGDWTPGGGSDGVADSVLSNTGDGSAAVLSEYGDCDTALELTHSYYVYCKARVTDAVCQSIALKWDGSTAGTLTELASQATPDENGWYTLSAVATPEEDFTGVLRVQFEATYESAAAASGKVFQIKEAMIIDLTAVAGAGSEPGADVMDTHIAAYLTAKSATWFTATTAVTSAQVTLLSTGDYVLVEDTFSNGDEIVINMGYAKTTLNDSNHRVNILSNYFPVPTGDQTITVTCDGFYIASMDYYKRYLYAVPA